MSCKLLHQESKNKIFLLTNGVNVVRQYAALLERGEQNSTRAKKFLADGVQYGRSMIEMLGVLAIIGVLSVGGIAGFSKMLAHQKIMQTQEQINAIAAKLSTVGAEASSFSGLNNKTAVKFGAIPSEAIVDAKAGTLQNPYGGDIQIITSTKGEAYAIVYYKLPKDACMTLSTIDWGGKNSSFKRIFITSDKITPNNTAIQLYLMVDESVKTTSDLIINDAKDEPLSPSKTTVTCKCPNQNCTIGLIFN